MKSRNQIKRFESSLTCPKRHILTVNLRQIAQSPPIKIFAAVRTEEVEAITWQMFRLALSSITPFWIMLSFNITFADHWRTFSRRIQLQGIQRSIHLAYAWSNKARPALRVSFRLCQFPCLLTSTVTTTLHFLLNFIVGGLIAKVSFRDRSGMKVQPPILIHVEVALWALGKIVYFF